MLLSTIAIFISSASLAVSIIVAWQRFYRDELAIKRDVLRRLVANSYRLTPGLMGQEGEPFVALNEAVVVFADSPTVMNALITLQDELGNPERLSPNIVELTKAMAHAARVSTKDHDGLLERFVSSPFTPGKPADR